MIDHRKDSRLVQRDVDGTKSPVPQRLTVREPVGLERLTAGGRAVRDELDRGRTEIARVVVDTNVEAAKTHAEIEGARLSGYRAEMFGEIDRRRLETVGEHRLESDLTRFELLKRHAEQTSRLRKQAAVGDDVDDDLRDVLESVATDDFKSFHSAIARPNEPKPTGD